MTTSSLSAKNAGLMVCRFCHSVVRPVRNGKHKRMLCPVCKAKINTRIVHSVERTWAYLIAATVLYLPANILPVMTSTYLGQSQTNTIISGVIELILEGFWPLAVIVFVASVIIPLVKIIVLAVLLISVQRGSRWKPKSRTIAYRISEAIGRWSMVDIYVISILVALVQFGPLASVQAGIGAICFAAVVILTMLAVESFDPRLIWDAMEHNDE